MAHTISTKSLDRLERYGLYLGDDAPMLAYLATEAKKYNLSDKVIKTGLVKEL